jgi:esterase/lipase superfamily enzyme
MALKITAQIGTDKGITSEAYVRIADYQISKYGSANFRIELFQSEDDATPAGGTYPAMGGGVARNQQIGESLYVALTQQVEETRTVQRMVPVQVEFEETVPGPPDEEGNPTTTTVTRTRTEMQEQDVEETFTKTVPDLSSAEGVDVFAFGYGHLKTKLEGLFGAANVVDC